MKNIIFIGTNHFAEYVLNKMIKNKYKITCVITKNNLKKGRGQKNTNTPVKEIALKNNINVILTNKINQEEDKIKKLNPDLIILTEFFDKIDKNIINIPKYGIINIHPSILPKLRGATPIQSAIINEFKETGISIIEINEKYDDGMILNIDKCKVSKNETYDSLFKKLKFLAFKVLKKTIKDIKNKTLNKHTQKLKYKTTTYKIEKDFYRINWNDSANIINKKIRSTFSIAKHHTFIENYYLNILETKILKKNICINKKNGEIIKTTKYGIDVKTGNGLLRLKKIQFPGKKINTVKDVLNSKSYLFKIGNNFKNFLEKK